MNHSLLTSLTPNLMVENVNETIAYYEKVLGFQKIMSEPETGPLAWAMMRRDEVTIMFQSRESIIEEYPHFKDQKVGSTSNFYIEVTNIEDFFKSIEAKAKVVQPMHVTFYGKKEFAIKDNSGYLFTFAECFQQ